MEGKSKKFDLNNPLHFGISFVIVIALIFGAINVFSSNPNLDEMDLIAQCITAKGGAMYGTNWCTHCQAQKEKFGSSFRYIDFVDCDKEAETCIIEGVRGYPTWKINGQVLTGTQDVSVLANVAECTQ
ncbi:MAG: glutaredoxin [Patescibacteria group bacterium]|jgi:glutaredoxin